MTFNTLFAVPCALALTLSVSGCIGVDCNLMYAPDALQITFDAPLEGAGEWSLDLSGDLDATCAVTLPLAEDESPSCDMEGVDLLISDDGASIEGITLSALAPDAVTLIVTQDGSEVLAEAFTPSYAEDEPNGKGCGERRAAEVVVDTSISGD